MNRVDPPSDLLARALEAEAARPEPPAKIRDRVLMRVVASATLAAGAGAAADAAAQGATAAADHAATGATAVKGGLLTTKAAALIAAVSFAGGAATGAGVHAVVAEPAVQTVSASGSAPASGMPPGSAAVVASAPRGDTSAAASVVSSASVAASSPRRVPDPDFVDSGASADRDLSSERAMIERARTALMRGNARAALETLQLHAQSFPRGRLSQERQVLTIHALVGVGRRAEAQRRADRFRARHPNSPMLAAIDAVLPSSPPASSSP